MASTGVRPGLVWRTAVVVAGLAATRLRAQVPALEQLAHRAWTAEDGAPAMIGSLAQTADGFLWLATTTGLFRFDGVRFEHYEPPAGQAMPATGVSVLLALPAGPLWIGYGLGGVSVLAEGRLVSYGEGDGLPAGTVNAFARDSAGTMWAATTRGLARLVGNRWQAVGLADGYPGGYTHELTVDRRGTLWAVATAGVYARPRGARRFERRAPPLAIGEAAAGSGSVREAPDGTMWAASMSTGLRPLTDTVGRPVPPVAYYTRDRGGYGPAWTGLFIDRAAQAWGIGMRDRLVRVPLRNARGPTASSAPFDTLALSPASGSSGRWVSSVLEDREGTVWVGTNAGLDHLRVPKFRSVRWPASGNRPVIAAGENGAVWMGAPADPLTRLTRLGDHLVPHPEVPAGISAILRDFTGDVWVGGDRGAWHGRAGRFAPVALPAELRGAMIQALAYDRAGTLWVSGLRRGVFRRRQGRWERFGPPATYALAMAADSAGRTWLGYMDGRLVRVAGDAERTFGPADGLRVGSVATLHVRGGRVWAGGELGVAVIHASAAARAERVTPFAVAGEPLRGVSGIVENAAGELWLHHAARVTRVPAAEVARALGDSAYRARVEGFDYRDRVDGPASTAWAPTLVEGTDGRIWITFPGGVAWIDPACLRRNSVPPPVLIRSLTAGGRQYASTAALTLPERTRALQVAYTATSLAIPERVRFRYRLVPLDTAWQEAGVRREAFYTNLDPGRYRFEVLAANEDGVWSPRPAALDVAIPPTFTQTNAFLVLCVVAACGAAWGAAGWRQRRVAAALAARYEATLAERTRVARELHDTLLSDMTGVVMRLQGAAGGAARAPTALDMAVVTEVAEEARRALGEARRAVLALRASGRELVPLGAQLADAARRILAGTDVDVRVERTGEERPYPEPVESEVLRIASEAVTNARKHAGARVLAVSCAYGRRSLTVRVRDDGRGFDPAQDAPEGHYGLAGMRERATAIGARLEVASTPGQGTVVTLVVQAPAA